MPTLFIGLLVLILVLWLLKSFAHSDPRHLIKIGRTAGGVVALAGAAFLGSRGQIFLALPLGVTGLSLLGLQGWLPAWIRPYPWLFGQKSSGQVSRVRSNFVEMSLDHDTGAMTGVIVAGRLQGTSLDALELSVLVGLLAEFDEESRNLLAAYLDRRYPRWREDADSGAAAGRRGATRSGKMSEEEAYQILGLQPGASADEIGRAHRGLMKKLHPDQGGSTYLAARVNEAKDVLLRRHQ
jgi:DnaJ-like protein